MELSQEKADALISAFRTNSIIFVSARQEALKRLKTEGLTLISQSKKTNSEWADKARAGQEVVQVIQGSTYLGVFVDGKYHAY